MASNRWANPINNNILKDAENNVLAGGSLEFYLAGTSTPQSVYSDDDQTVDAGSTLTADAYGLIEDFHLASGVEYKIICKDSGGVTKWTRDNIQGIDGAFETRLDALESSVSDLSGVRNYIMNSSMGTLNHGTPLTISSSFQESEVAEHWVKATNSTAGTIAQGTSTDVTAGYYCAASAVSTNNAAAAVTFQSRVASGDTGKFVSSSGVFTCYVYQDTGSAVDVTITVKKADAKDNFSSLTTIQASGTNSVNSGTWTLVTFSVSAMGDCRNGIAIETSFACGVQTTKNYYYTMPQFTQGTTAIGWTPESSNYRRYRKYPIDYLYGAEPTIDSGDTSHDVNIAVGSMRDATDSIDIEVVTEFTKQIDAVWASGDDTGGFPSGVNGGSPAANTWYYIHVISDENGAVDGGFDSSATATNLLADATAFTYYRCVGAVLTDGSSNIIDVYYIPDIGKGKCRIRYDASVTFPMPLHTDYLTQVTIVGAGGGGSGTGGAGSAGSSSTFAGVYTAGGGQGAVATGGYDGGIGGKPSFTYSSGMPIVMVGCGQIGESGGNGTGGENGLFPFSYDGAAASTFSHPALNITGGTTNTAGVSGGGGGGNASSYGGGGGGAAIVLKYYYDASATVAITVGTGGAGDGASAAAGGNGYVEILI